MSYLFSVRYFVLPISKTPMNCITMVVITISIVGVVTVTKPKDCGRVVFATVLVVVH